MMAAMLSLLGLVVLLLGLSSRPRQASNARVLDLTPMLWKRKP